MTYAKKEMFGKWGFVNDKGEPICEFIYDEVRDYSENIAAVRINDKWGYIDEKGNQICEIRYDAVGDFQSKLGVVEKEGKKCYLNQKGEEVAVTNFLNEEMVFEGCKSDRNHAFGEIKRSDRSPGKCPVRNSEISFSGTRFNRHLRKHIAILERS